MRTFKPHEIVKNDIVKKTIHNVKTEKIQEYNLLGK